MRKITTSQYEILKALSRYMFLTIDLIDTLGIFKNKVSIYRAIRPLKEGKKPLVHVQNFGVHATKGQLSSLLYLSKYGKEILLENAIDEEIIKIPNSKSFVSTDYFHRVTNITFFVYFDMYLKANQGELIFLDYYFSRSSDNRAKNRIDLEGSKYIIPDIVTKFKMNNRDFLYLVEVHNGKDSNKAFNQILQHIKAIDLGSPRKKYGFEKNNRVVFIFEFESCMNVVIKKMSEVGSLNIYVNLFLFRSIEEMRENFNVGWLSFEKELRSFC